MTFQYRFNNTSLLIFVLMVFVTGRGSVFAAGPIQSQAAISLSFDEASGDANAIVAGSSEKYHGKPVNGPKRIPSPFWNQSSKRALLLNAGKTQFIQLSHTPYLDRPDAVSLSFFFLSLHNLNDATTHGIVAKRFGNKGSSNYGINYVPKSDVFQLYVNDGSGFHIATYSVKNVIGFRRLAHLTATFQIGDAPAPDADSDKDDVLIRLFMNGQPVKPTKAVKGKITGNDIWLTDVKTAALLNDAPLTLGCSFPNAEPTSGLIDEFLLFSRALSPQEAADLFIEASGPNGIELARRELLPLSQPPSPQITALSLQGLQVGVSTRLSVNGRNLGRNPRVEIPGVAAQQTVVSSSNAGRLTVDLNLPLGTKSGYYPFRIKTDEGISNAIPIAIDHLPQRKAAGTSLENPANLPAAFSGTLSGSQQIRIYFRGKAGARVVADVEARRLGARMEPVLEIKTEQGTPLLIVWGQVPLKGDVRGIVVLPSDGLYFVELHDLAYKAPGRNPFRLKIGDLTLIDAWFPSTAVPGTAVTVEPVGVGFPSGTKVAADLFGVSSALAARIPLPGELNSIGPTPALLLSNGTEIMEIPQPGKLFQTIDTTFSGNQNVPVVVNGRIEYKGERDRYVLHVSPGQKLNLSIAARSINSPLDAELSLLSHPQETVLAIREDRPGSRDPTLEYTVPANVQQIQVAIRDLHGRGGSHFLYRLQVAPAVRADFRLTVMTPQLNLPENGRVILRAKLNRNGYDGPITLSLLNNTSLSISPTEIPAGSGNSKVLIALTHQGGSDPGSLKNLKIVAESVDVTPNIRRIATVFPGLGRVAVDGFRDLLPTAIVKQVRLSLDLEKLPPALFKGVNTEAAFSVTEWDDESRRNIRLTLLSTETLRLVDPKNPLDAKNKNRGNKPLVRVLPNQVIDTKASNAQLKLVVPFDVAEREIGFVIRADVLPHPYSNQILVSVYSEPFHLPVRTAVAVTLDPKTLNLVPGQSNKIRGTLKRTAGFDRSVDVNLVGLPKGFSSPKVSVSSGHNQFELTVSLPETTKPETLQKISLAVSSTGGGTILPNQSVTLKVVVPPKKK